MNTPSDPKQPRRRWHPGDGPTRALKRLTRGVGRAAAAFAGDTSGAVMILTALMALVLMGFAGLAVDVGGWYATKRSMQSAADAAAMDAGLVLMEKASTTKKVIDAATQTAAANGFDASSGATISVAITNARQSVDVVISKPTTPLFSSVMLGDPVAISANAVATVLAMPICLLSLEKNKAKGLEVRNSSEIFAPNCAFQVNSRDDKASQITDRIKDPGVTEDNPINVLCYAPDGSEFPCTKRSWVQAAAICITGDHVDDYSAGYSPTPKTGPSNCPPVADPLVGLAPPSYSGCDENDLELNNVTTTLGPGVYCNGLTIKGTSNVEFLPGVYIIEGGRFKVENTSSVHGEGVGFYLANGAKIEFKNDASVSFSAPTAGDMAGILFFQQRNKKDENKFDAMYISRLEGTIYFPDGTFKSKAKNCKKIPKAPKKSKKCKGKLEGKCKSKKSGSVTWIAEDSAFTVLIARKVKVDDNTCLALNTDYVGGGVPVVFPEEMGTLVQLTR